MSSGMDMTLTSFAPTSMLTMSSMMMSSPSSDLATPKPTHASKSITSSASTPTPTCRRLPVQHDLTTPRARARVARLRAHEAAERREDLAALITTPAQWALLRRSFASVKTEFTDLDGMSWDTVPGVHVAARPESTGPERPGSSLDDGTMRAARGAKRRLSVSAPGWRQQAVKVAGMGR